MLLDILDKLAQIYCDFLVELFLAILGLACFISLNKVFLNKRLRNRFSYLKSFLYIFRDTLVCYLYSR